MLNEQQFGQTLYRGVYGKNAEGAAAANRRGELGNGMYGKAIYATESNDLAESYANTNLHEDGPGRIMRGRISPHAEILNQEQIPKKIANKKGFDIMEHAKSLGADGVQMAGMHVITNPKAVDWDDRTYSTAESRRWTNKSKGYYADNDHWSPGDERK